MEDQEILQKQSLPDPVDPPAFAFELNRRYDLVFLDLTADNQVSFVYVDGDQETTTTTGIEEIVMLATELKGKGLIGEGKDLPVTIITFGTPENMKFKFSTFIGMV